MASNPIIPGGVTFIKDRRHARGATRPVMAWRVPNFSTPLSFEAKLFGLQFRVITKEMLPRFAQIFLPAYSPTQLR